MILLYNILQILVLLILGPLLVVLVLASPKYRPRIPKRLGYGLGAVVAKLPLGPRVWIHALSVGEMASVRPLLEVIRQEMPEVVIILSATTRSGEDYACRFAESCDCLIPFPLDGYWVVKRFVSLLRPDLFVLVETDFWPNLLSRLNREKVPCLLVNGRVTQRSMSLYHRFRFLFSPVFSAFWRISMQMADDAGRLVQLGVDPSKIVVCGNLKYDMAETVFGNVEGIDLGDFGRASGPLLVAGSTHKGEEEIVLDAFTALLSAHPSLSLIIAPRDVKRAQEIADLCVRRGVSFSLRTGVRGGQNVGDHRDKFQRNALPDHSTRSKGVPDARKRPANYTPVCEQATDKADGAPYDRVCGNVLILDTLGELALVYRLADIAFVGGSLVDQGGHNPLEPAFYSVPVLFGPYMSDFAEISQELIDIGGGRRVTVETFVAVVDKLLVHDDERQRVGHSAHDLVSRHKGAAKRFLVLIREALGCER